jgi:transcriptional regulator with XRE-family HTH domain
VTDHVIIEWETIRATMRRRRMDLGLTQAEVGHMMDRSQDYVSYLENNTRSAPTMLTVTLWMRALGGTLAVAFPEDNLEKQ